MKTIRLRRVAGALAATSWLASAAYAAQPLLTPAELSAAQQTSPAAVVIDIREPKLYAQGHIPGALNAPYGKWRGPATNRGGRLEEQRGDGCVFVPLIGEDGWPDNL